MSNGTATERVPCHRQLPEAARQRVSLQSRIGLNAVNFFLAEVTGVVMPFLGKFLLERGWRPDAIGIAAAVAGLGVCLAQTPAGLLVDWVRRRRALLAAVSLLLGACYGLVPLVAERGWLVDGLVFVSGVAHAFFLPLLGALALGLVGHAALARTMGINQGWNHAGNIAAALSAMLIVGWLGTPGVFYTVALVSVLAASSVFVIRRDELDEERASGDGEPSRARTSVFALLRDRRVLALFVATALFHMANAPVMPLVGQYIAVLHGSDTQVAAVVLVAQTVMVPVALAAGWLCGRWGRKPVFALGFLVLPVRIALYALTDEPWVLVALQALDGIGAGIYGVVIAVMCADLTRGTGHFNGLQGLLATALSIGGVLGPFIAGLVVQQLGFAAGFLTFAAIAAVAAAVFLVFVPETQAVATGNLPVALARRQASRQSPRDNARHSEGL